MTVIMDNNTTDQTSISRVQRLYNKNVELDNKRRKAAQARIPSDPNIWQQMRENYEAIILEDHAFSEKHETEYTLWQLHYRRFEELRGHFNAALASSAGPATAQNGKNVSRGGPERVTKIRSQIKTFLSEATGFYHDLMLKIRAKYGLQLGYLSDDPECQISLSKDEVKKGLISCHRCLIYLGDLARYKGLYGEGDSKARDFVAASSYYMQASSLWSSSGNPHHQLAIVASYLGDELVSIYRYFRSLAVETPFPTARDNLIIAFEKNRQSHSLLLEEAKNSTVKAKSTRMTGKGRGKNDVRGPPKDNTTLNEKTSNVSEVFKVFSTRFVRLNGILFTRTSLETFAEVLATVKTDLLELLSTGPNEEYNFGSDASECRLAIVRLIAILIFTVHNVKKESENQSYAEILQRSVLLQNAFTAIFYFMGHILERCSQLNDPSVSYLLPGIMVFVEWLACHQDIAIGNEMEEKQSSARLYFWNQCIEFLNKLVATGSTFLENDEDETCFMNMGRYEEGETGNRLALFEDFELRGFLPLVPAHLILDFTRKYAFGSDGGVKEKKARANRIVAAGKALVSVVRVGDEGIYFDAKMKKFVIGSEPIVNNDDDYLLANSLGNMDLNSMLESNTMAVSQMPMRSLQVNAQYYMDGEEEDDDEEIVFKPSANEKLVNGPVSTGPVSSGPVSSGLVSTGPVSNGFVMQNFMNTSSRVPSNVEYLQPIYSSSSSKGYIEQGPMVNGLGINGMGNLGLYGNGVNIMNMNMNMNTEAQNYAGAISAPIQQVLEPSSRFDTFNSSSTGVKKVPVSRPLRHFGPPPGFGSVPSKSVDESSSKNPPSIIPMDDYSWLDGYQNPSSVVQSSYQNHNHNYTHTMNNNNNNNNSSSSSSIGLPSFPFPGKQISNMQAVEMENTKVWQEYQQHLKQQQEQIQKGNQHQTPPWEGRFFV